MSTARIGGNTRGLKASVLRSAERLLRRKVPQEQVVSTELSQRLCELSHETGRQLGLLINRRGTIDHVIFGDASRLWLPDIGRLRAGRGRLRGIRLVHTHLRNEGLTRDDLTDLALLRLDLVAAITMTRDGSPRQMHCAHLVPGSVDDQPWQMIDAATIERDGGFLDLMRSLEQEFARQRKAQAAEDHGKYRAVVVHVHTPDQSRSIETCVGELQELCRTAGVAVVDVVTQGRRRLDPRYVIGRGKLDDVLLRANQLGAELLIFDPDLTPAQARAIADVTEVKVIDRTMLILDIFAQHARTRDGKLQVELAQLRYSLPRLVAKNTMMSRLTGEIGGRGPGETKLELNRRRARERISQLENRLENVAQQRQRRRSQRQRNELPVVSVVGYTNAGKSTLVNCLTNGGAIVEDKLFATLAPVSRRLRFPSDRDLILTDTVGFIHDLPDDLVHAFRATLEELREADLLLHLVDASDAEHPSQIAAVRKIIGDLQVEGVPSILVMNKSDRLEAEQIASIQREYPEAITISALDAQSTRSLLKQMETNLWRDARLADTRRLHS